MTTQIIQVGDRQLPFLFRYKALKKLCQYLGIELEQLSELEKITFDKAEKIIFLGFESALLKEGKEVDFAEKDIEDWIDEDFSLIERCLQVFGKQIQEYTADTKKKEATPTKKAQP